MDYQTYETLNQNHREILVLMSRGFAPSEIDAALKLTKHYTHDFVMDFWLTENLGVFSKGANDYVLALELKPTIQKIKNARPKPKKNPIPKVPERILQLREETKCHA